MCENPQNGTFCLKNKKIQIKQIKYEIYTAKLLIPNNTGTLLKISYTGLNITLGEKASQTTFHIAQNSSLCV